MNRTALLVVLVAVLACFMVLGFEFAHMQKVIDDQRTYIEAGACGRYQGEE